MAMKDVLQRKRKLTKPQIRVWIHPNGDDFAYAFTTLKEAKHFARNEPKAESMPLIAYMGKEFSISEFKKKYPNKLKKII